MLEQSRHLIEKAHRFAGMDNATLAQQSVRTLLVDLAQALQEAIRNTEDGLTDGRSAY